MSSDEQANRSGWCQHGELNDVCEECNPPSSFPIKPYTQVFYQRHCMAYATCLATSDQEWIRIEFNDPPEFKLEFFNESKSVFFEVHPCPEGMALLENGTRTKTVLRPQLGVYYAIDIIVGLTFNTYFSLFKYKDTVLDGEVLFTEPFEGEGPFYIDLEFNHDVEITHKTRLSKRDLLKVSVEPDPEEECDEKTE